MEKSTSDASRRKAWSHTNRSHRQSRPTTTLLPRESSHRVASPVLRGNTGSEGREKYHYGRVKGNEGIESCEKILPRLNAIFRNRPSEQVVSLSPHRRGTVCSRSKHWRKNPAIPDTSCPSIPYRDRTTWDCTSGRRKRTAPPDPPPIPTMACPILPRRRRLP
jgi:hypothetical protein